MVTSRGMTKRVQIYLAIILVTSAILLFVSPNSNPDNTILYKIKRLQENIFSQLQFSPSAKVDYKSHLLDRRAIEIEALLTNKRSNYLWSSSLRYAATAGQLTDFVLENNLIDKKEGLVNQFKNHQQVLRNLLVNYPEDQNPDDSKYIQDDINYLNLYLEKLSGSSQES